MKRVAIFIEKLPGVALFLLAFCLSTPGFGASPVLDRVIEQGVLKVAMSGEQQPFNFTYGNNKSLIGFDVDLAEEIARLMRLKLEVVRVPFDDLLDVVETGRVDMVISGMTITAARSRRVSFVGPYMLSGKSMLASSKVMSKLKTPAGINSSGIKLVALKGSTSESLIQQELPKASLTTVANYDEGLQLLLSGKASGMVADMPILALTRQKHRNANLQIVTPPLSIEPLGVVIARGDTQLENLLRNYMSVFEKTGLFVNLHKKWFEIGHSNIYEP